MLSSSFSCFFGCFVVDRRWLRLIFTREFNMHDAMMMWDGLFAVDPSFELAPWICVAMLMRIRNQRALLPSTTFVTREALSDDSPQ